MPINDMHFSLFMEALRTHAIAVKAPSTGSESTPREADWKLRNMFLSVDTPTRSRRATSRSS